GDGLTHQYTVTVQNTGQSDARNVVVTDVFPSGFTQGTASTVNGTFSGNTWTIGTIAAGTTATLNINYTVPASTSPGNQRNTVNLTTSTPNIGETSDFDDTNVVTQSNLQITKTDGLTSVTAGDGLTHQYTITVQNTGKSDARNV